MLYAGNAVCILVSLAGVAVLLGFFPPHAPQKFRIMFGIVLLLYGIYRFITLRVKQQQRNEEHLDS
jgi:uncharacterized membrane protein YfcA